jgi:hypothetical protein
MPRAPKRSADSTALRIARRNATRFSSCIATDSPISCASSSGFWISWMLMKTSRLVFFWNLGLQLVDFRALAADDDARARGVDVDLQLVGRALDLDLRDAGVREARLQRVAQLEILRAAAWRSPCRRTTASARSC